MTRPEPAQTCLCVQPQNTTIKRLHVFIYVREKLWDSSCFTFQDVIYRIPGWYLRVCPPPDPPHLSLSLSLYGLHYSCILQLTHLLQRGGRTFYNMWRFILSQIYLNAAETWILHMQDSQQRFRTWGSNIEILIDGSRFQSFIDHWTQLYTSVNSQVCCFLIWTYLTAEQPDSAVRYVTVQQHRTESKFHWENQCEADSLWSWEIICSENQKYLFLLFHTQTAQKCSHTSFWL